MFYTSIQGSGIYDENTRFRVYFIVVLGIFAFGSLLYWRSQSLIAADYVELPKHQKKQTTGKAKSKNYQIEYLDDTLK